MSVELRLPRGQRRRFESALRKSHSRIEAMRARILLRVHEARPVVDIAARVGCVAPRSIAPCIGSMNSARRRCT